MLSCRIKYYFAKIIHKQIEKGNGIILTQSKLQSMKYGYYFIIYLLILTLVVYFAKLIMW